MNWTTGSDYLLFLLPQPLPRLTCAIFCPSLASFEGREATCSLSILYFFAMPGYYYYQFPKSALISFTSFFEHNWFLTRISLLKILLFLIRFDHLPQPLSIFSRIHRPSQNSQPVCGSNRFPIPFPLLSPSFFGYFDLTDRWLSVSRSETRLCICFFCKMQMRFVSLPFHSPIPVFGFHPHPPHHTNTFSLS